MAFLLQVIVDLLFVVSIVVLWVIFRRPKSEDPRLSAGLLDLQTKIAVLEDLGDRTERQVQQLMTIIENKVLELQKKITQADNMQGKISKSMEKSLEVVKIFQDKIPHEEIRERQNTIKFVKAALLANQGCSAHEISDQIDLPYGEIEFIIKVNKKDLAFDQHQLPEWVQAELNNTQYSLKEELAFLESPLQAPPRLKTNAGVISVDQQALQHLGAKFRQAQVLANQTISSQNKILEPQQKIINPEFNKTEISKNDNPLGEIKFRDNQLSQQALLQRNSHKMASNLVHKLVEQKKKEFNANLQSDVQIMPESKILKKGKELGIRPVVFPRIEVDKR
jgi:hypothetical protein